MITQPQSGGVGDRDWPRTDSTRSDALGDATANYLQPRKSGQVPQLTVPDTFDEPLTDAQIGPWEFRAEPTH